MLCLLVSDERCNAPYNIITRFTIGVIILVYPQRQEIVWITPGLLIFGLVVYPRKTMSKLRLRTV